MYFPFLKHGGEIDELEKQLEVQTAIIEAQRSLLEQAKNRGMKKDRKKEVKMAEEKYQILEDKLYELKNRQQRRPYVESRFDSPGKKTKLNVQCIHTYRAYMLKLIYYCDINSGTPLWRTP